MCICVWISYFLCTKYAQAEALEAFLFFNRTILNIKVGELQIAQHIK